MILGPPVTPCPKLMTHGPCGGVREDGGCEVGDARCAFVDVPTVKWRGGDGRGIDGHGTDGRRDDARPPLSASAERLRALIAARPVLVADLPARPLSAAAIASTAGVLAGRVDAVLAGDAGSARVQFPPAYRAVLLAQAGMTVWSGVNCRDRNRVALEGELAALADARVGAVHAVTGDHTATGHRPDAAPVFDLDATELTALARRAGHLVSVAESPAVPPVERRAERLAQKVAAGADVCFVNHCGGAAPAAAFVQRARHLGVAPSFIACVPLVIDAASAALLASFTSLVLPEGFLDRIAGACDVRAAGMEAATALAGQLLEAGFDGINLSGGPGGGSGRSSAEGSDVAYAEALAEVADRLGVSSG